MKKTIRLILAIGFLLLFVIRHAKSQNCKAEVRYLDERTLQGIATYYFNTPVDSVKFWLAANGYAGKNTKIADTLFKRFNPCLYFAEEKDLGSFKMLSWHTDEGSLTGVFNPTKEFYFAPVPASGKIVCTFTLILPKRCGDFGTDGDYILLEKWLPMPVTNEAWTYLVMLSLPENLTIISGEYKEEKNSDGARNTTLISKGFPPELALTAKKLTVTKEKDTKGNTYQLYRPEGSKKLSYRKKQRYIRTAAYNFKDSSKLERAIVDDKLYAKFNSMLFLTNKDVKSNPKSFYPTYRYTDRGNHMVGFALSNQHRSKQDIYYFVNPMFSFTNDFNWNLGLMKSFRIKKGSISQITPVITYKKFHYFTNNKQEYTLDYHRFSPRLKFLLRKQKWLNLEYAFIREQTALYEGNKINFSHLNSSLWRLRYDQEKSTTLYHWTFTTALEYFTYENIFREQQDFTKLTATFSQTWKTSLKRNLSARIFAGKFISNDQRYSNNYSDFITKGSIALIHQGWNDYAYDGVFVARKNQNGFFNNQTDSEEGGFKNAPSNTTSLGLSNDFAMSINLTYDLFQISPSFQFFTFGDAGIYRQQINKEWQMKNLYSAGLGLKVSKYLYVYLPLINHTDINSNYRNQNLSFFERWNFQLQFKENFHSIK